MKHFLPFVLFLLSNFSLSAQDVIELVSGEEITGTVLEVGYEIRYLRADFTDGPVYVLERAEVLMITYANGREEIINLEAAQRDGSFAVRENYLKIGGNRYYEGFRLISKEDFLRKLQQDPAIYRQFQAGLSTQRAGYVVAGGGMLVALIGVATSGRRDDNNFNSYRPTSTISSPRTGLIWTGMGIGLLGSGIALVGTQKIAQALDNYNIAVGRTGGLVPAVGGDGIGVVLRF